ncbi:MAG TPA: ribulokinase [Chitinophagaceae bacterium]|nr:ribulokinase [Chitinophagaceae bacterium]
MTLNSLVIGLDFGTDSARAILIDTKTGKELASSRKDYSRWKQGLYCNPAKFQFRQHPLDYLESMEFVVKDVLRAIHGAKDSVKAISVASTGSTPSAVDEEGIPLAMKPAFSEDPNAMFVLWKDHTGQKESEHINAFSKKWKIDYTRSELCGDYSVEHFWTKALHIFKDPKISAVAHSFVESSDWIPGELTGNTKPEKLKRGMGIGASRAMWNKEWGGYPPNEYFKALHPALDGVINTFDPKAYTCDQPVGTLTFEWAERLGLNKGVVVAVGNLDCHAGAIGAGVRVKSMVEIIGTSTCAITVAPKTDNGGKVQGVPQQADDMILPGVIGYEGGQSCFGDLYAWFKKMLMWPLNNILAHTTLVDESTKKKLIDEIYAKMIPTLTSQAKEIPSEDSGIISTDWINGRRSPNVDYELKGTIAGLTLSSTAPLIYKSLVEATAFGAKAFIEQFQNNGGLVEEIIAVGGISQKSPFVMQVLADVINMPIYVIEAPEACALGAAMCASVVAGIYPDIQEAQCFMKKEVSAVYRPDTNSYNYYQQEFEKYLNLEEVKQLIKG